MITKENLNKLFDMIIEGKKLKTHELNQIGLNSKDLKKMIDNKTLRRVKIGTYELNDVSKLFVYGIFLEKQGNFEKANLCFEIYSKLEPKNILVYFKLIRQAIYNHQYDKALDYIDIVRSLTSENKIYQHYLNYFIYLLSCITDLKEPYRSIAKNLKFKDIYVFKEDTQCDDYCSQNKSRTHALKGRFARAKEGIRQTNISIQSNIIIILLTQAEAEYCAEKNALLKLITQKKYKEIINLLESKSEQRNLFFLETYTLLLSRKILEISETKQIPPKTSMASNNMIQAIKNNDFETALKLYKEVYKEDGNKNSQIYLLLQEITSLISSIEKEQQEKPEAIKSQDQVELSLVQKAHDSLVKNKGVVILKPQKPESMERIANIIKGYKDLSMFTIGSSSPQICIRYTPPFKANVNINDLIHASYVAYKDRNCELVIKINTLLIQVLKEPKASIYATLGLSYLRLDQYDEAVKYLTIANEVALKTGEKYDFSDTILILTGHMNKYDTKKRVHVDASEFETRSENDCYGIKNFDLINSYIVETGLDVESACLNLGLTLEEIDIINLIYAKKYYFKGNSSRGDLFLRAVEQSPNKTPKTRQILSEIRTNKKLYINKGSNEAEPSLLIRPKNTTKNS